MPRLDLVGDDTPDPVVQDVFTRTRARGADVPNLYRTLAHSPAMLATWVGFAWPLRDAPVVPRSLRELAIMRAAGLADAHYETAHHRLMALDHGVRPEQLAQLASWSESSEFDARERALLRFVDAVAAADVDDDVFSELRLHFSPAAVIELVLTASVYYGALPRVIQALRIELEPRYGTAGERGSRW